MAPKIRAAAVATEQSSLLHAQFTGTSVTVFQNPISQVRYLMEDCVLSTTFGRQLVGEVLTPDRERFLRRTLRFSGVHWIYEIVNFLLIGGLPVLLQFGVKTASTESLTHNLIFMIGLKLCGLVVHAFLVCWEVYSLLIYRRLLHSSFTRLCMIPVGYANVTNLMNDFLELTLTDTTTMAGIASDGAAALFAYARQHSVKRFKVMIYGSRWASCHAGSHVWLWLAVIIRAFAGFVAIASPWYCSLGLPTSSSSSQGSQYTTTTTTTAAPNGEVTTVCAPYAYGASIFYMIVMLEWVSAIFLRNRCC